MVVRDCEIHAFFPLFGDEQAAGYDIGLSGLQGHNGGSQILEGEFGRPADGSGETPQDFNVESRPLPVVAYETDGLHIGGGYAAERDGIRRQGDRFCRYGRSAFQPVCHDVPDRTVGDEVIQLAEQFVASLPERERYLKRFLPAQGFPHSQLIHHFLGENNLVGHIDIDHSLAQRLYAISLRVGHEQGNIVSFQ